MLVGLWKSKQQNLGEKLRFISNDLFLQMKTISNFEEIAWKQKKKLNALRYIGWTSMDVTT